MKEKRVELFSVWPYSSGCSQDVAVISFTITNWLRNINHGLLLREGAVLLLRIAHECVLPSLVARCFFVDVVVTKRQML